MNVIQLQRPSLADLLALIEAQPGEYRHLFRGQTNAAWSLTPALYRVNDTGIGAEDLKTSYDLLETRIVDRFFSEGMAYIPPLQRSYANDRILAQHFGVPTRLLDWTRDPLVAAFFALEDWKSEDDAAIFMILPGAESLPQFLRHDTPLSAPATALPPPAIDRRIPAQKSIFTIHPYGIANKPFVPLDQRPDIGNIVATGDSLTRGFAKIIIPRRIKRAIHQILQGIGLDRRNLFPGLDGIGSDIASRIRSGQVWR